LNGGGATIDGSEPISPTDLPARIKDPEEPEWQQGVIGTQRFWEAATV
jgi:hypothetical protein